MRYQRVESTCIQSIGYNAKHGVLGIRFKLSGLYQYFEVEKSVYRRFLSVKSKGKFFNRNIKAKAIEYQRIY